MLELRLRMWRGKKYVNFDDLIEYLKAGEKENVK